MEVGVLYSGGKDSTLAALFLDRFYDVTVLCCSFGVTDDHQHAAAAARAVGFPSRRIDLDRGVAETAVERMVAEGYPRNGIQQVHEHALETCADREFDAIADGTRRDDRVPTVARSLAQSIEDRYGVPCLSPLAGFGREAIDDLVADTLVVETGPSDEVQKGDYEAELRALLAKTHGEQAVEEIFPDHVQSRVTGRV
jgi:predicted subunit of tRNA(5-methylaminomethyl-2-thiouridylate) methyltransferase